MRDGNSVFSQCMKKSLARFQAKLLNSSNLNRALSNSIQRILVSVAANQESVWINDWRTSRDVLDRCLRLSFSTFSYAWQRRSRSWNGFASSWSRVNRLSFGKSEHPAGYLGCTLQLAWLKQQHMMNNLKRQHPSSGMVIHNHQRCVRNRHRSFRFRNRNEKCDDHAGGQSDQCVNEGS